MAFFQNSVINKHLKTLDKEVLSTSYAKLKEYFHNPEIQKNIRDAKEEQFQEGFLRELFVNILGYTLNPHPNYNLTTEHKNEKGAKKADGAILQDGKAIAVIELKGTDTKDLDKINAQAFNYKNNQSGCIYVITSNFEKLRFFIHNSVEHLDFNLFTLTEQEFQLLWLSLSAECLLGGVPVKIKEESLSVEGNITKQLYVDYSAFKNDLWQNLVKNHPSYDQLLLYKKSQKLLDRFLFILFTEDSGLLPPNSISRIVERFGILKEEDAYKSLYDIFKQFFGYIYVGRKGKTSQDDIYAYNGGLFIPDDILDSFVIDDEILQKHVMKLTAYDFQSDVDVNILGHIFEHSLNEIENVTARLQGQEVEKSKTKRKKEGVYYTPKYITKYIVENTVGKLCKEKKTELVIIDEEYAKGRRNRHHETIRKLDYSLQEYRKWLLEITICDPACGSGAFLNQTLEFLIGEHQYIDELESQLLGYAFEFPGVENHILEKNLYGVDINEESIEIAKLSLWLRTAQRGRKLTSLNNNLKCGNSLIDDSEVAGDKAFNWQKEFPDVFVNGGFDVVIGNPPYVRQELFKDIKPFLEQEYKCYNSVADLYTYFIEKGIHLTNNIGKFSFILPNKFLKATYGKNIRKVMLENSKLELIFDFDDFPVFEDATTYPIIYVLNKKEDSKNFFYYSEINKRDNTIDPISLLEVKKKKVSFEALSEDMWNFIDFNSFKVLQKIRINAVSLSKHVNKKIYRGLTTGKNDAFIIDSKKRDELISLNRKNADRIKVLATGKE
ncbi:MAG: Eco57I restriction-modification methylase domain-containing protein, partial [Bacteroidales bacterium]|nr:Eco57I restriction-modification methylase domain-containing protein [Bacteroidales bacterium]